MGRERGNREHDHIRSPHSLPEIGAEDKSLATMRTDLHPLGCERYSRHARNPFTETHHTACRRLVPKTSRSQTFGRACTLRGANGTQGTPGTRSRKLTMQLAGDWCRRQAARTQTRARLVYKGSGRCPRQDKNPFVNTHHSACRRLVPMTSRSQPRAGLVFILIISMCQPMLSGEVAACRP